MKLMMRREVVMNKPVAIITARGGSKRIPRKNIRDFLGKPIIAYSIQTAIESGIFDDVIVSTDDNDIAEISIGYGANVPFFRSKENSDDFSDTSDVIREVILKLKDMGREYESICCIYPTAPFVTTKKLIESYGLLADSNAYNVVPMVPFSFPPQRGLVIENGFTKPTDYESINKRSQDLDTIFHDAGQFYWIKTEEFLRNPNILMNNTIAYPVPETEVQDIDNEEDWILAELKYKLMKEK